jgi:hypothetical protein
MARLLRGSLPSAALIVPNPDHPLLIRGPDLIVAAESAIVAIFTPSAMERRSPAWLKSRLIMSRLAFPTRTRCILLIERSDEHLAQSFVNDFAEIVSWSARATLLRLIESRNFIGHHRDLPWDVSAEAQQRFSNAMTVMRLVARLAIKPFTAAFGESVHDFSPRSVQSGERPRARRPVIIRRADSLEGVALADISDGETDTATVANLITQQVDHVYSLDNGVPYPRDTTTGLAVTNDWPMSYRDPEKLIHAAAFSGWAFVLSQRRDEIRRFAQRMKFKLTR